MFALVIILLVGYAPCSFLREEVGAAMAEVPCRRTCIGSFPIVRLRGGGSSRDSDDHATVANEMQEIVGAMTADFDPEAKKAKRELIRDGDSHDSGSGGENRGNQGMKRRREDPGRGSGGRSGQKEWSGQAGEALQTQRGNDFPGGERGCSGRVLLDQVGGVVIPKNRGGADSLLPPSPARAEANLFQSTPLMVKTLHNGSGRRKDVRRGGKSETKALNRVDQEQGVPEDGRTGGNASKLAERDAEWERMPTPPVSEEAGDNCDEVQGKKVEDGSDLADSRASRKAGPWGHKETKQTRSWPNRCPMICRSE